MASARDGAQWVLDNYSDLGPGPLRMLLDIETERDRRILEQETNVKIPEWFVRAPHVAAPDEIYKTQIDGTDAFFVVRERKTRRSWNITWMYTQADVDAEPGMREYVPYPVYPGCAILSNHEQDDFNPANVEKCGYVSVVGAVDMDSKTTVMDARYTSVVDRLRMVLSRGYQLGAERWMRYVWSRHPLVCTDESLRVGELLYPVENAKCTVCGLNRTTRFVASINGRSYLVGSVCARVIEAALKVTILYNDPDWSEEAMGDVMALVAADEPEDLK